MEPTHSVTFTKGVRVGARRCRYEYVTAASEKEAVKAAKLAFPGWKAEGFRVTEVREWK